MIDPIAPVERLNTIQPVDLSLNPLKYQPVVNYLPPLQLEPSFDSSRPVLTPPGSYEPNSSLASFLSNFVEILSSIESTYLDSIDLRLKSVMESYHQNLQKKLQDEREIRKRIESDNWWNFVQRVALCLLGASSLISSYSLIAGASSPWELAAGFALFSSSAASIIGSTLLNSNSEMASLLTVAGGSLSLLGGMGHAFFSNDSAGEMVVKIVISSLSIFGNLAELTKETLAIEVAELKASNSLLNSAFEKQGLQIDSLNMDLSSFHEITSNTLENCSKIQHRYEQITNKIISTSAA